MLIVSRFAGTYSISGVSISGQVMQLVLGIGTGLLAGFTIVIAQYYGKQESDERFKEIIGNVYAFPVLLALGFSVILLICTKPVLAIVKTPAECYSEALWYYVIMVIGTVFVYGYNSIAAVLRAMGDSTRPMIFVVISSVINIILDIIFIAVFQMGAAGAALATIIAQLISFLISIWYLHRINFSVPYRFSSFKVSGYILKELLKVGIPASVQESIINFSLIAVIAAANGFGVYASAAVGIASKVNVIGVLPCIAFCEALAIIVGQSIGAGKLDRAIETAKFDFFITAIYGLVMTSIFFFFSREVLEIFTSDANTLNIGANYYKFHGWDYFIVMPLAYMLSGLFTGTGHTLEIAVINTITSVFSRMVLVYVLAYNFHMGINGIGLAFPISTAFSVLLLLGVLVKGDWKNTVVKL